MMNLDALIKPGRQSGPDPAYRIERPIIRADLELVASGHSRSPGAEVLKSLSARHHRLAQFLASGETIEDAAALTGYSYSRAAVLKTNPAFLELIEFYRRQIGAVFVSTFDRLADLGQSTVAELQARIEDEPESFSVNELVKVSELALDRSGSGPVTTNKNFNVNLNLASRLDEARRRAKEAAQILPPEDTTE